MSSPPDYLFPIIILYANIVVPLAQRLTFLALFFDELFLLFVLLTFLFPIFSYIRILTTKNCLLSAFFICLSHTKESMFKSLRVKQSFVQLPFILYRFRHTFDDKANFEIVSEFLPNSLVKKCRMKLL